MWSKGRAPDPMFEYEEFRSNVLDNLTDRIFDKPLCEVMHNQKYFNGIGNYLRAEIIFRLVPNKNMFFADRKVHRALYSKKQSHQGLENTDIGLGPQATFSSSRAQLLTIWTDHGCFFPLLETTFTIIIDYLLHMHIACAFQ